MTQAAFALNKTEKASVAHVKPQPSDTHAVSGYEIGWEFASCGLVLPDDHLGVDNPVRRGWEAGRAGFGLQTMKPTEWTKRYLMLRLQAWRDQASFESWTVNARFMKDIDAIYCPVTRVRLIGEGIPRLEAQVARLNTDAAYAAGNLVTWSQQVTHSRRTAGDGQTVNWKAAWSKARQCEAERLSTVNGLNAAQWARLAVLLSFVTPLPHDQAAQMPLLVLPPNRVRVINSVQALQVMLTLQFARAGFSKRMVTLQSMMPCPASRREFYGFMVALMARRVAAGPLTDQLVIRRTLEDAWTVPAVQEAWQSFASLLSEKECDDILMRMESMELPGVTWRHLPFDSAVDGWELAAQVTAHHSSAPKDQAMTLDEKEEVLARHEPDTSWHQETLSPFVALAPMGATSQLLKPHWPSAMAANM